jgi:hypothetical protein
MKARDGFILRQSRHLLSHDRHALIAVIVLMLVPYMAWASITLLSLVTLRKGWKPGSLLVIPALTAHILVSLSTVSWSMALIDALIRVVPCYAAACVLRTTSQWRAVALLYICCVMFGALLLQVFAPELIQAQFMYFKAVIRGLENGQLILGLLQGQDVQPLLIANYLLGFQSVCLFLAIISPLMFARSLQARLYYPGGFQQEMLNFRGDKYSVFVLLLLVFAAYQQHVLAINGLPLVLFYFVLAGISLAAHELAKKMQPLAVNMILFVPLMLLPRFVFPFYVLLAVFDGLFNFRLYLSRAGKTL